MRSHLAPVWAVDLPQAAPPKKLPTKTVEIECVVVGDRPSYCVGGVRQKAGDRTRLPLFDALGLQKVGKARIVEGSEKVENL